MMVVAGFVALGGVALLVLGWLLNGLPIPPWIKENRWPIVAALVILVVGAGAATAFNPGDAEPDEPLTVSAQAVQACTRWYTPGPIDLIDIESIYDGLQWTYAEGSAPASPGTVLVTVQGTKDADVVLTGIDIDVVERRAAPAGVLMHARCGDAGAFRWLEVDLDTDDHPRILSYVDENAGSQPVEGDGTLDPSLREPVAFPYHVSRQEAETFVIVAYASSCDCEWTASVHWQSEGKNGSIHVDNNGKPWRTVGLDNVSASCLVWNPSTEAASEPTGPADACVSPVPEEGLFAPTSPAAGEPVQDAASAGDDPPP